MKILLLTNCISQPDDTDKSVNDLVYTFAYEWKKAGHNVIIINNESKFPYFFYKVPSFVVNYFKKRGNFTVPSIASRNMLEWERDGIPIVRLPMFKLYPHARFFNSQYMAQSKHIMEFLEKKNFIPDVITGHWIEPQLKLVDILGHYYDAKKALVVHGELSVDTFSRYANIINRLDVLFFRSFVVLKKMEELYGRRLYQEFKMKVCFSGIPNRFIEQIKHRTDWKTNDGILKCIYVGRLERYKRVDCIIDALNMAFPEKNFNLEIIGDGPELTFLKNMVNKLNLQNNISFIGRIPRDSVIEKMQKADCFCMISENEVFGLVYLEAMACGCITIAAKKGGVDGIIKHGVNGFLCEQGNSKELSNILHQLDEMTTEEVSIIRYSAYDTVVNFTDSKAAENYLSEIL